MICVQYSMSSDEYCDAMKAREKTDYQCISSSVPSGRYFIAVERDFPFSSDIEKKALELLGEYSRKGSHDGTLYLISV